MPQMVRLQTLMANFSIKVTPQSVLHVSYIGYVTQTVKVGNKKNISIVMEEDSKT